MKKIKRSYVLSLFLLLLFACSKEDSNQVELNGGEVFLSQIVTLVVPNATLNENEYDGTLDGEPIQLSKSEDDKLLFMVPSSTELGMKTLHIAGLNTTVRYDVKETILTDTPEATLTPFLANLNAFSQTLDSSPESVSVQNSLNSFNSIYSNATNEEKTQLAILYKANKALIDHIILEDFSSVTGRDVELSDITLLKKHSLGVIVTVGGAFIVLYAPETIEKVLGVAITAIGAYKTKGFFNQLATKTFNKISFTFNNILGINDKSMSSSSTSFLILQNEVSSNVSFKSNERVFISGDVNKTQSKVVSFFKDYNRYNYYITKVNTIIQWLNNNISFANFSLVPKELLPATAPLVLSNITTNSFNNVSFSVNNPNLELVSSSLQSSGQLNVKVKIVGTPPSLPINSFLNYSYTDDFNSFSGRIPIQVNAVSANPTLETTIGGVSYTLNLVSAQFPDSNYNQYRLLYENNPMTLRVSVEIKSSFSSQPVNSVFLFENYNYQVVGCNHPQNPNGWYQGNVAKISYSFYDGQGNYIESQSRESFYNMGSLIKTSGNSFTFSGSLSGLMYNSNYTSCDIDSSLTVPVSATGQF